VIKFSDCKHTRLSTGTRIKSFDCGDPDLNDFLFNDSRDYLTELYAVTYLFEYGDDTVAFFSVSNDKITYDEKKQFQKPNGTVFAGLFQPQTPERQSGR